MNPTVSIIMPVGPVREFLRFAVKSVTHQTVHAWELLLINDGPDDRALEQEISAFGDHRIRYFSTGVSRGVAHARNVGLTAARGEFVAFLDADDLWEPHKLRIQVDTMQHNPHADLCASYVRKIDRSGQKRRWWGVPNIMRPTRDPHALAAMLLFRNVLCLSSVLGRTEVFASTRFDESYQLSSDYELWSRVLGRHACIVVPRVLVCYREHDQNMSTGDRLVRWQSDQRIQGALLEQLGVRAPLDELVFAQGMHSGLLPLDPQNVERYRAWMERVREANARTHRYNDAGLAAAIADQWRATCAARTRPEGIAAYAAFLRSAASFGVRANLRIHGTLLLKSLLRWGER